MYDEPQYSRKAVTRRCQSFPPTRSAQSPRWARPWRRCYGSPPRTASGCPRPERHLGYRGTRGAISEALGLSLRSTRKGKATSRRAQSGCSSVPLGAGRGGTLRPHTRRPAGRSRAGGAGKDKLDDSGWCAVITRMREPTLTQVQLARLRASTSVIDNNSRAVVSPMQRHEQQFRHDPERRLVVAPVSCLSHAARTLPVYVHANGRAVRL